MKSLLKRSALLAAVAGLMIVGVPTIDSAIAQPRGSQPDRAERPERGERPDRGGDRSQQAGAQIGQPAPNFELKDLEGKTFKLSDHKGKIVVLEWFNPDCPFVVKHHKNNKTMEETYKRHKEAGVVWVAINSGAPGLQGAGKDRNVKAHRDFEMPFPVLLDEPGAVGRLYSARVTPHMFIINREGILVYNGAIDNDRSAARLGDINYVDQALSQVIRNETVTTPETRPYGCTVKYKD